MKWELSDSFLGLLTEQQICSKVNVMGLLYGGCKGRKQNEILKKSTLFFKSAEIADMQWHFSEIVVSGEKKVYTSTLQLVQSLLTFWTGHHQNRNTKYTVDSRICKVLLSPNLKRPI